MLILPGAPALSSFRIEKRLASVRSVCEDVVSLTARFVHFAELERPLSAGERDVLDRLLTYGPTIIQDEVRGWMICWKEYTHRGTVRGYGQICERPYAWLED